MKPTILFVDDEQHILNALRLSLREYRSKWDMLFVTGAKEALDIFKIKQCDVVVADLRMPEIDGATLLREIRQNHPATARIILSGYSDQESSLKNICIANEYLCKPCRIQDLTRAISRALDLRELIENPKLKKIIAKIDNIPTLPNSYIELNEALLDDHVSAHKISKIIYNEMTLSATILRIANSPFFGIQSRISNIIQAITFLGVQTIRALIISDHFFSSLSNDHNSPFSSNMLWHHCIRVSGFARKIAIAENLSREMRDDCVISGMLHDIGKLVLDTKFPDETARVIAKVNQEEYPLHEAEISILGVTHADIGAYLLGQWGFSREQTDAVRLHQIIKSKYDISISAPVILHVANYLDHELVRLNSNHATRSIHLEGRAIFDIEAKLHDWRILCHNELRNGLFE